MRPQINWESFRVYNQDARGINFKFEDLCRQLFARENLSGNVRKKHLHANPNNADLETEPILNEKTGQRIGFQAKYFESSVKYDEIKNSAKKIISHYKGEVDHVYIYSNKPITSTSKSYQELVAMLREAKISIELVTDTAILDLVQKYPDLGLYYFGNHSLTFAWFEEQADRSVKELGERYNPNFNVSTHNFKELSLFVQDQYAAKYLNAKKSRLAQSIEKYAIRCSAEEKDYLVALENTLQHLEDVTSDTLAAAVSWKVDIDNAIILSKSLLEDKMGRLENKAEEQYEIMYGDDISQEEKEKALEQYRFIRLELQTLEELLLLPDIVEVSQREKQLMQGDILAISGQAGTGKSQMLAHELRSLLTEENSEKNKRIGLLLPAEVYLTNAPIEQQIMQYLKLDYSFDKLLEILEVLGEKDNQIVPVFIDALNETWLKKTWQIESGLPDIIKKIESLPHLKLAFSYRPEYEKAICKKTVLQKMQWGEILQMQQNGFAEAPFDAVQTFLNYYHIPFTPVEFFYEKLENPLFLTLYCRTYRSGEDVSLPTLYERLLDNANKVLFKQQGKMLFERGYSEEDNLLRDLIDEIAVFMVDQHKKYISKTDLCNLSYWRNYDLTPMAFIKTMKKEGILHDNISADEEVFRFAYDQMNDYYPAKAIIQQYKDEAALRQYLQENILNTDENNTERYENIDLFINICALYAQKFGRECIDLIDPMDDQDDFKQIILSQYVESLQWRNPDFISADEYVAFLEKYPQMIIASWAMLIGNSVKVNHPLNADFLHQLLLNYPLNQRDYLWTIYINGCEDNERIVQLVQLYQKGNSLEITDQKQIELLLTLFAWLLTSSNRWLRDCTSKAMIEILKNHFELCQKLLQKFEKVNDPYAIQRLFGIVFGACCKRKREQIEVYEQLAEYVYDTVFAQTEVYPDILLRDYACLIIERFLFEKPDYQERIDVKKIRPPYQSQPIPVVEENYNEKKYSFQGIGRIVHSMKFEPMGGFNDFGRYVFRGKLHSFVVDQENIYNYAIYFILNELGYTDELFLSYDSQHNKAAIERIGKKYQWIAMYNIFARVSDHYDMLDENWPSRGIIPFEGPWNPYVRDFDPTLNENSMSLKASLAFTEIDAFLQTSAEENAKVETTEDPDQWKIWLATSGYFQQNLQNVLLLVDGKKQKWIALNSYYDTNLQRLTMPKLQTWSWLHAYFVKPEQRKALLTLAKQGKCVVNYKTNSNNEIYTLFNREYPWAPSCEDSQGHAWIDPDLEGVEGKILHATTSRRWEAEYDASKEQVISWNVVCAEIIESLHLRQLDADGCYYDTDGKLAAYDTDFIETRPKNYQAVVIRQDLLDKFLTEIGLELVWLVDCEKEIHKEEGQPIKAWQVWNGIYTYDKSGKIQGELYSLTDKELEKDKPAKMTAEDVLKMLDFANMDKEK